MPGRKPKHRKYQQLEGQDGWTHVVRGPRLPSKELNQLKNTKSETNLSIGQNLSYISIPRIRHRYELSQRRWAADLRHDSFEKIFNEQINLDGRTTIDNAIVLGLGSLARDNMDSSSMDQLVAFEHWLSFLRSNYDIPKIYIQDPQFHQNDKVFLNERGFTVVEDPEAYLFLTGSSLLFAPYLPWQISHTILYVAWPALFISNAVTNNMTSLQPERRDLLLQSVVREFYTSRNYASLGGSNGDSLKSEGLHSQWLKDIVVFWTMTNDQTNKSASNESNTRLRGYFSELEQDRDTSRTPIHTSARRIGLGEWRHNQGFVFDAELRQAIERAHQDSNNRKLTQIIEAGVNTAKNDKNPEQQ